MHHCFLHHCTLHCEHINLYIPLWASWWSIVKRIAYAEGPGENETGSSMLQRHMWLYLNVFCCGTNSVTFSCWVCVARMMVLIVFCWSPLLSSLQVDTVLCVCVCVCVCMCVCVLVCLHFIDTHMDHFGRLESPHHPPLPPLFFMYNITKFIVVKKTSSG